MKKEYKLEEVLKREKTLLLDTSAVQFYRPFLDELARFTFLEDLNENLLDLQLQNLENSKFLLCFDQVGTIREVYEEMKIVEEYIKKRCGYLGYEKSGIKKDKLLAVRIKTSKLIDLAHAKIMPTMLFEVYENLTNAIIAISKGLNVKHQDQKKSEKDLRTDEKIIAMAFTKTLEEKQSSAIITEDFNHFPTLLRLSYRILTSSRFGDGNKLLRERLRENDVKLYIHQKDGSYCLLNSTSNIPIIENEIAILDNPLYKQMRDAINYYVACVDHNLKK